MNVFSIRVCLCVCRGMGRGSKMKSSVLGVNVYERKGNRGV